MVPFVAAKLMRAQGHGVTLIVSPLLAPMRNQIEAASRLKLKALTINSTNTDNWDTVRHGAAHADRADLFLISPERLANDEFVTGVLQPIAARIGMLVVDEAHCISDWGARLRPDYRRIGQVLERLPNNIAVLATTATANHRVERDVGAMGDNVKVQRGPLMRNSLALPGHADAQYGRPLGGWLSASQRYRAAGLCTFSPHEMLSAWRLGCGRTALTPMPITRTLTMLNANVWSKPCWRTS